jgi:hypothetical protein
VKGSFTTSAFYSTVGLGEDLLDKQHERVPQSAGLYNSNMSLGARRGSGIGGAMAPRYPVYDGSERGSRGSGEEYEGQPPGSAHHIFQEGKRRSQIVQEVRDLVSGTRQGVDTRRLRSCFDAFAIKKDDTSISYVKGVNIYRVLDAYGAGLLRSEISRYVRDKCGPEGRMYFESFVELASAQDSFLRTQWQQAAKEDERVQELCGSEWTQRLQQLVAAFDILAESHGDGKGLEVSALGEVVSTHCEIISISEFHDVCGMIGENVHGLLRPEKWMMSVVKAYQRVGRSTPPQEELDRMIACLTEKEVESKAEAPSWSHEEQRRKEREERRLKRKQEKEMAKDTPEKAVPDPRDKENPAKQQSRRTSKDPDTTPSRSERKSSKEKASTPKTPVTPPAPVAPVSPPEEEKDYSLMEETGAVRIQSAHRGRQARKEVEEKRKTMQDGKAEETADPAPTQTPRKAEGEKALEKDKEKPRRSKSGSSSRADSETRSSKSKIKDTDDEMGESHHHRSSKGKDKETEEEKQKRREERKSRKEKKEKAESETPKGDEAKENA